VQKQQKIEGSDSTNNHLFCPMKYTKVPFILMLLSMMVPLSSVTGQSQQRDFYELRIYHIENPEQEKMIDTYLKNAFLPALHASGIAHVGVFKPVLSDKQEKGKKMYVFIPYTSMEQFLALPSSLEKNREYAKAGREYINAPHDKPPYKRL